MKECVVCGRLITDDDWDVCENCQNESKTYETVREMGERWKENARLNGFWRFCFTDKEIDDILYDAFVDLPEEKQRDFIELYCEDDTFDFVRWIKQECR